MPPLSVLIKPASSLCNMKCNYCFYRDVSENRACRSYGIMSEGTLSAMMKNIFAYADSQVSFTFQGGEPTLAGEKFFESFHRELDRFNTKRLPTSFFLQTNGYALSDGLLDIFSKYRYLLGVSLDGTKQLHDAQRCTCGGEPTYDRINENLKRLDARSIDYNILTVITEQIAKRGAEVYRYLRDRGFKFLQFIPYVSDFGEKNEDGRYSLSKESYSKFLDETFREYRRDFLRGSYVSVRQFDNFVRIAAGLGAECCGMGGRCFANLVIEADGSVYPCDFYVIDKWKMGNILSDSVEKLLSSEGAVNFVKDSFRVENECLSCPYVRICRGGCRRHREDAQGNISLNRYCESYKAFFEKNINLLLDMAGRIKK